MKKICKGCGKEFIEYKKKADGSFSARKYCDECSKPKQTKTLICQKCGKSFEVGRRINDPSKFINRKYCDECNKPITYRDITCKSCGKIERVFSNEHDFYSRIYCKECKETGNYISYAKDFIVLTCEKCGKEFKVGRSENGKFFLRRKFCDNCTKQMYIDNHTYTCKKCGKKFVYKYKRVYCDDCVSINTNETKITHCEKCGKEIILKRKFTKDGKPKGFYFRRFCDDCISAKIYTKICPICNKEFTTKVANQICCSWECSRKQRAKTLKLTTQKNWGVDYPCLLPQCQCNNSNAHSKINIQFEDKLQALGINFISEYRIGNYSYDIMIKNLSTLIEINPTYTHSVIETTYKAVDKNYHLNKTNTAKENGYHCIHIWDWDDWDKILSMLKPKIKLYARKLELKEITKQEANEFLDVYHLQNSCYGNSINLGLYQDDLLVQVMTFGKPRYNKNYEWELLRLCSHANYMVVGGAEKLFKYFIDNYNPQSIISYCDISKFSGDVYKRLGFEQTTKPQPREHWCNYRNGEHITAALLLQKGYDKLFNTNYGKGTNNRELMLQNNWLPIYDCGQINFIWKNNK